MNKVFALAIFIILGWSFVIHPFEVPDEQSHYATTHFLVDQGRIPSYLDTKNLSLEEQEVQYIFGIMTDGTNKYSYHPEYRMEPVSGLVGKYEAEIQSLNTPENRSTYTIHQAAIYPPLYYWITSGFYRTVSGGDIILRLFVSRLASVLMTSAMIVVAYQIGQEIFRKKTYAASLATMTLFFPMTTFIGAGVNSDNLHNLLFAGFIYLCLRYLRSGWDGRRSLLLGLVIGLDLITKPQAYIMLPIFALAFLLRFRISEWKLWFHHLPIVVVPILLIAGWQEFPKFFGGVGYSASLISYGGMDNFVTYARGFVSTLSREMIVWYWGIFKWTTVLLPKPFWWLANRILFLAIGSSAFHIIWNAAHRKFDWLDRVTLFAYGANVIYIGALFWFDWQFYQQYGKSLGMQARYYMPLLTLQMFIILHGITSLGWIKPIKKWLRRGLIIFFLGLQLAGIYTLISSYYDLSSFNVLISQMSQYKPWFAKGDWWYLWGGLYLFSLIYLTWTTVFSRVPIKSNAKVKVVKHHLFTKPTTS